MDSQNQILNAALQFSDLSMEQQQSFRAASAVQKRLLPAGTRLRKLVGRAGGFNPASAYWMLEEDWKLHVEQRRPPGATKESMVKARLAVSNDFQPDLGRSLHARLLRSVWGFHGQARPQPMRQTDPTVVLIGGAPQVVIPNLTLEHICVLHAVS